MKKILLFTFIILLLNSCSLNLKNLPIPEGNFKIGTDTFIFEDKSRLEWFTEDNENDYRKIAVQMWYPASEISDSLHPYIDNDIKLKYIAEQLDVSQKIVKGLSNVKTNSYYKSPIYNNEFPVIIFSHGLGGTKIQNSINIENLVSFGYIVISIDHSYDALITILDDKIANFDSDPGWNANIADFRSDPGWNTEIEEITEEEFYRVRIPQINTRAKDVQFVIDQLYILKSQNFYIARNCNLNKIGVFGHSFGGGTSILASHLDSRISACLNLDGWLEPIPNEIISKGLNIPFCYIGQVQKNWTTAKFNEQKLNDFHNNNSNLSYIFEIKNSEHMDYADIPYLTRLTRMFGLSGKAGKTLTKDLNFFILGFFDQTLKNQDSNWIERMNANYKTIYKSNE